jgi:hypothetical protein
MAKISAVPGLSGHSAQIAGAIQSGQVGHVIGQLPGGVRSTVEVVTRTAFTTGLDQILLVAAIIALAGAVISLVAIRGKDFAQQQGPVPPAG